MIHVNNELKFKNDYAKDLLIKYIESGAQLLETSNFLFCNEYFTNEYVNEYLKWDDQCFNLLKDMFISSVFAWQYRHDKDLGIVVNYEDSERIDNIKEKIIVKLGLLNKIVLSI